MKAPIPRRKLSDIRGIREQYLAEQIIIRAGGTVVVEPPPAPTTEPKTWDEIARAHPEMQYAHENASIILQNQHPAFTLSRLRSAYPHVQFRWGVLPSIRRWRWEALRRALWALVGYVARLVGVVSAVLLLTRVLGKAPLSVATTWVP